MSKKRVIVVTDLKEFATNLIAKAKNSDRAVFRLTEDDGAVIKVTFKDLPMDSTNYQKAVSKQPETFWGVYNTKARVEDIIRDLSVKE